MGFRSNFDGDLKVQELLLAYEYDRDHSVGSFGTSHHSHGAKFGVATMIRFLRASSSGEIAAWVP